MQQSKTIYFSDYFNEIGNKGGLTLAFSEDDSLYSSIHHLSSHTIREVIGYHSFNQLKNSASDKGLNVNAYVKSILNRKVKKPGVNGTRFIDGLQATFVAGKGSIFHDWYPYLEGYSPDFVRTILSTFAPNAKTIYDPFCGSGTTAIISALDGKTGFYSEVNPVCRYIIDAKYRALKLNQKEKVKLIDTLESLAENISKSLSNSPIDKLHQRTFEGAFGSSKYFSERNFLQVLRAKSLSSSYSKKNDNLRKFFDVAVLRSLVPSSLLVRRGDLRFKTEKELLKPQANFEDVLADSLRIIASDLADSPRAEGKIQLVGENARDIPTNFKVDAIITSPPYLNGTNYFRNTKIELWYLGHLSSKEDLRSFRNAAITSGINDVSNSKNLPEKYWADSPLIKTTLEQLQHSYDIRIPRMVKAYFDEMSIVIQKLKKISNSDTVIAVDLGDSSYGDVWVRTDDIIASLFEQNEFCLTKKITLRQRVSRSQKKLSQTLQVFKPLAPSLKSHIKWQEFKSDLPHQSGEFAKRNWGHALHSLCSYQGKLKPSIANHLVNAFVEPGGKVLDVFSGVGTIPFEARLNGSVGIGFDISPTAVVISKAKLENVNRQTVNNVLRELEFHISKHKGSFINKDSTLNIKFNGHLEDYFHPRTFDEILSAREFFLRRKIRSGSSAIVLSSLLHILHGNRPYALSRNSHPIIPFAPTGNTEYRPLIPRLKAKVFRSLDSIASVNLPDGKSYLQDATKTWPKEVREIDAIITSPPFYDSTRFYTANWMRLWFSGWELNDFKTQPKRFVDERQKKSFEVYDPIFRQAKNRLKLGGVVTMHLGKSRKCDMASAISSIGEKHLKLIDQFDESVSHCETHGFKDKGTVTAHQYLVFQKINF